MHATFAALERRVDFDRRLLEVAVPGAVQSDVPRYATRRSAVRQLERERMPKHFRFVSILRFRFAKIQFVLV
jgi:hypothetical protein